PAPWVDSTPVLQLVRFRLGVRSWRLLLFPVTASTATARAAAVLALVARSVRHHQHAALGAGWRTLVRVARRVAHRLARPRRRRRSRCNGIVHSAKTYFVSYRGSVQLQIVRRDELSPQPTGNVVQHRRGEPDVRIRRDAAWFK